MHNRLMDKVVIVTGAAQGLGKVYSQSLAKEGAIVCAADINSNGARETAESIKKAGGRSIGVAVDVSDQVSTEDMAKKTNETFGRIDVLISNAAIYYGIKRSPFEEISVQDWDRMMAVNVKGPWLCARAVSPFMKRQRSGKIINISSGVAFAPNPYLAHYATSKSAIIGLTRALSKELGEFGITVNAIAPGLTMTDATRLLNSNPEAYVQSLSIKREQQPEDLVGTVLYLASDDSNFLTGQTIVVDGGRILH